MLKQVKLSEVPEGKNFTIWNREFTVLQQEKDKVFVLATKFATIMPFREEGKKYKVAPNDFRDSSVRAYLNGKYIDELEKAGADRNKDILPLTIDLKCAMGEHEYGTDTVLAGLLTWRQYEALNYLIPRIEGDWEWFATPHKTPNYISPDIRNAIDSMFIVEVDGEWESTCDYTYCSHGVRPALNFNPLLKVTYEADNSEETDSKETDSNWDNYISYLHEWAAEHSNEAYAGMSPVCYDEWLDNECEE